MQSISIALATFNGDKHLEQQLQSLHRQSVLPTELLVADDASSDRTMAIVCSFAKSATFPVRITQNPVRLGYRANFMKAAEACTSKLIAFCDQDDIWHPEKLSRMASVFDDPNVLLAYHNSVLIEASGREIGSSFRSRKAGARFLPLTTRPWSIVPGHAQVVRRSLLRLTPLHAASVDPYCAGQLMPHDQWYPFWASVLGHTVYLGDRLAQYRLHDANVSGWAHINWLAYARDHIANAETYVEADAIGAKNRLDLLRQCHGLLTDDEHVLVDAAVVYYEGLLQRSVQRRAVYESGSLPERARHLVALMRRGGYAYRAPGALGLDALMLDAFIGVPSTRIGRRH